MGFIRTVILFLFAGLFAVSCSPEKVGPTKSTRDLQTWGGGSSENSAHGMHGTPCGISKVVTLVDDDGQAADHLGRAYGRVEIMSTQDTVWMLSDLGVGWFATSGSWHVGTNQQIPLDPNGDIRMEALPTSMLNLPQNQWSFKQAVGSNATCYDVLFHMEILRLNFFGGPQPGTSRSVWARQFAYSNGFTAEYCYTPCTYNQTGNGGN
ncbi:MAG: hypothetical protein AAF570_01320 [Bacteroidota bacterium]